MKMSDFRRKATFYRALGDPVRLGVLQQLLRSREPLCVCDLAATFARDQSVVFRHVKVLEAAGIITTSKEGRRLLCSVGNRDTVRRLLGSQ
jgi:ArsR family transcriptional regulator